MRVALSCGLAAAIVLCTRPAAAEGDEFEPPVRLEAGGAVVDTEVGHAAPLLHDLDRDGKRDLLVGQFGDGKLKFHRNVGTEAAPALVQQTGAKYYRRYNRNTGTYVWAPFTEVDTRRGTWVAAPFARVYSGRRGTWVRAPFVNLWVPRD